MRFSHSIESNPSSRRVSSMAVLVPLECLCALFQRSEFTRQGIYFIAHSTTHQLYTKQ